MNVAKCEVQHWIARVQEMEIAPRGAAAGRVTPLEGSAQSPACACRWRLRCTTRWRLRLSIPFITLALHHQRTQNARLSPGYGSERMQRNPSIFGASRQFYYAESGRKREEKERVDKQM